MRQLDELFVEAGNFLDGLLHGRGGLDARVQKPDGGAEKTFFGSDRQSAGAFDAFNQNLDVAVRKLDALHDIGERSYGVNLFRLGVVHRGIVLGGQEDLLVPGESLFESADAGFAADDEGGHLLRKNNHVAHRHHGYALHFLFFSIEHWVPEFYLKRPRAGRFSEARSSLASFFE